MHSGPNNLSLVMLVSNVEKKKEKRNPTKTPDLPQALSSPSLSSVISSSFRGDHPGPQTLTRLPGTRCHHDSGLLGF